MGFVVDKMALEQVFSEYFGFSCKFSFHRLLHTRYHPGLAQKANQWPTYQVDTVSSLSKELKKSLCDLDL
jgi:hypothetical protein